MKKYKYIGLFKSSEGVEYKLEVYCNSFIQALFLLTAKAIEKGSFYQLYSITDVEKNDIRYIDDILLVGNLIKTDKITK